MVPNLDSRLPRVQQHEGPLTDATTISIVLELCINFMLGLERMVQWLRVRITLLEGPEFNSQYPRQVAHSWNSCCRGPDASKDTHVSMVFTHTHPTENKVLKTKLHCISGGSDFLRGLRKCFIPCYLCQAIERLTMAGNICVMKALAAEPLLGQGSKSEVQRCLGGARVWEKRLNLSITT